MYTSEKTIRFTNENTIELTIKDTNEIIVYKYASFGERFLARIIDVIIIIIPQFCIPIIPAWLYWSLQQSGDKQRTLGQGACNIQLLSVDGQKVTFGQATGRFFANFLNLFTFLIGYIMFFMTDKKQCLHDSLSETIVVKEIDRKTLTSIE
ncbi:RDD family protein [Tenacibaculum ovolyticum]|uniref:RDD family protein n=1 Tax=Tenacibaculum ovolyticum TaxID=104270 RepID=UPI0007EC45D9|nr:RDD family protein [Tenacibaculum ovolyticum]